MGHDIWVSKYAVSFIKINNQIVNYHDNRRPTVAVDVNEDLLIQCTYNYGRYSNICWEHTNYSRDTYQRFAPCDCEREHFWHVYDDLHCRLGDYIFEKTSTAIKKLTENGYPPIDLPYRIHQQNREYVWTLQETLSAFCYHLLQWNKYCEMNPGKLFGIHDHKADNELINGEYVNLLPIWKKINYFIDSNGNRYQVLLNFGETRKQKPLYMSHDVITKEKEIERKRLTEAANNTFLYKNVLWSDIVRKK